MRIHQFIDQAVLELLKAWLNDTFTTDHRQTSDVLIGQFAHRSMCNVLRQRGSMIKVIDLPTGSSHKDHPRQPEPMSANNTISVDQWSLAVIGTTIKCAYKKTGITNKHHQILSRTIGHVYYWWWFNIGVSSATLTYFQQQWSKRHNQLWSLQISISQCFFNWDELSVSPRSWRWWGSR